jgi:hypothetical protein
MATRPRWKALDRSTSSGTLVIPGSPCRHQCRRPAYEHAHLRAGALTQAAHAYLRRDDANQTSGRADPLYQSRLALVPQPTSTTVAPRPSCSAAMARRRYAHHRKPIRGPPVARHLRACPAPARKPWQWHSSRHRRPPNVVAIRTSRRTFPPRRPIPVCRRRSAARHPLASQNILICAILPASGSGGGYERSHPPRMDGCAGERGIADPTGTADQSAGSRPAGS